MLGLWGKRRNKQLISSLALALFFSPIAPVNNLAAVADAYSSGYDSEVDYAASFSGTQAFKGGGSAGNYERVIPANDNTFTAEAWFKVKPREAGHDSYPTIFSQNQNTGGCTADRLFVSLSWDAGLSKYWIHTAQNNCGSSFYPGLVPVDEWAHIAYVSNGNQFSVYLNGSLLGTVTQNMSYVGNNNAPFAIGGSWNPVTNQTFHQFPGQIDQVKVWNFPLSRDQIKASMHSLNNAGMSGLEHLYTFNAASQTTYDYVGDAHLTATSNDATSVAHLDVKSVSSVGSDYVFTFPRTYLPGKGGWMVPANAGNIRVTAVAGGGAGGSRHGGGGAGGAVAVGSNVQLPAITKVQVGQGGLGAPASAGCLPNPVTAGQDTVVGSLTLKGGGSGDSGCSGVDDVSGGSSGGSSTDGDSPGILLASSGTSGYTVYTGRTGGQGRTGSNQDAGGGGAGALANGGNSSTYGNTGGPGGSGYPSDITGQYICLGAGGGGGISTYASAGVGVAGTCTYGGTTAGTGSKGYVAATSARPNSGSGGGGAGFDNGGNGQSGSGGSGVVIIRYTPISTVTFVSYGSPVASSTVNSGTSVARPTDPTTTSESVFLGWTTTAGNSATLVNWPYTLSSNQTLYGLWRSSPGLKSEVDYAMSVSGAQYAGTTSANPFPASRTSPFTLEAWVYETPGTSTPADLVSIGTPLSVATSFNLRVQTEGSMRKVSIFRNNNGTYTDLAIVSKAVITQGAWVHIAVTYNGSGTFQVFQEGQLVDTITNFAFTSNLSGNFAIGRNFYHDSDWFKGRIDQVKIWNKVLTQAEVQTSMHTLGSGGVSSLAHHWDFNDASANYVPDRVGTFDLIKTGSPNFVDVKVVTTTSDRTIVAFPRTYLPGLGGWKVPAEVTNMDALVVGGGGGGGGVGGRSWSAGGGAGGSVVTGSLTPASSTLSVVVGMGGKGGSGTSNAIPSDFPQSGNASSIDSIVAGGGGRGGHAMSLSYAASDPAAPVNGGGGGGQAGSFEGTQNQAGFSGGDGRASSSIDVQAGGGGAGAGGHATHGSSGRGGNGGPGTSSDLITPDIANHLGIGQVVSGAALFGGGGGGGKRINRANDLGGLAGAGGGGAGGLVNAGRAGLANTGGGGGGAGGDSSSARVGGFGGSGVVVVSYLMAVTPTFVTSPQSVSIRPGGNASFTVAATGNGTLTYQWQKSTDGGSNWSIVGTNTVSYSVSNQTLTDDGAKYRVVVTNTINGSASTTSSIATLTVAGVTLTSGGCSAMVIDDFGVSLSETVNGGCLVKFTEPGSNIFTVPANVSNVQALVVGGGGGGGVARTGARGGGGGGGGGGAHRVISITATTSQQISLTVGSGGAGGTSGDGQNGGSSLLSYMYLSYTISHTLAGGGGGKAPSNWPGGAGQGGTGAAGAIYQSGGSTGGAGATDPGDRSYYQPKFGNAGSGKTFAGEYYCIGGGGGGGNRELASDPYFHWEPRSVYCSGTQISVGGSGGYHDGASLVLATSGAANSGSGGGGGSYNRETNIARAGAAGADGLVAFYFTPATGEISLSSVAAMSYSATTRAVTLTKDNPTANVTWTTSHPAVCTVSGTSISGTVSVLNAGLCEVSVVVAAENSYGRGVANTSFQIDKIVRQSSPSWVDTSISVPFGGTYDLWPNIASNASNSYRVSTSGTVGSCSVTGYTLNVGSVGDTCTLDLFQLGDARYLEMQAGTPLSVTVTKISQSPLVITSGNQMDVNATLTVSAAGGTGGGALSYHVASQGGTGCVIDSSTGVVTSATAAGTCTVYAKRAASTNYDEVTSSNQAITVNKISQSLSWLSQPQARYLAGNTYVIEATASSQLAVSYTISSGLCSIASTTITFTGSGDCVIQAYQLGSDAYLAASTISQTVSAGKINQTMTFSAIANKSWGSLAFSLSATASSGLAIAYSEDGQTTDDACDVSTTGVVTIKNVGTCAVTATQAGNSSFTSVSTTRLFEVTANQAGAPFIGSVSFGDRQLNASFFTPSNLGGGTVSAYELRAYKKSDGTLVATNTGCVANAGATQSCSVMGLENGEGYELKVAAITQAGLGLFSASSSEIIPAANPEAVRNLIAIEGNGQLTLQWLAPTSLGGGSFDQYRIFWRAPGGTYQPNGSPGASLGNQASTSFVITGLVNGVSYDVKITTVTNNNTSELQSNTAEVRQTPYTVPDAPASVAAFDNTSTLLVAWQPPVFDGGNPIDQYVVTKDGSTVCTLTSATSTSCEVAKPSSGTSTIEVKAKNDAGLSPAAQTTFTVVSSGGSGSNGGGFVSLPIGKAVSMPSVTGVSGSNEVPVNGSLVLVGANFNLVEKVLVDGVAASFYINSPTLITIRIPIGVEPGDATISLIGAFGNVLVSNLFEVEAIDLAPSTKVTVGTFLAFAAVYTKNYEGHRLSMKIGYKWRVVPKLGKNYTVNLTKVGVGKTTTVMVYLDRKVVAVKQVLVK